MEKLKPHAHIVHPDTLKKKVANFDSGMVNYMAKTLGSVKFIWFCITLDLLGLIGLVLATVTIIVTQVSPLHVAGAVIGIAIIKICTILVLWVTFVAQAVIQLIALPVLQNYANRQQAASDAKADADHQSLTYLANLQDEQMVELKNQSRVLKLLQTNKRRPRSTS